MSETKRETAAGLRADCPIDARDHDWWTQHVDENIADWCDRALAALEAAEAEVERLRVALADLASDDIDCLDYPQRDVYGDRPQDFGNRNAPLWTESGLYGRVGKEAARTLLARVAKARAALDAGRGRGERQDRREHGGWRRVGH